MRLSGLIGLTLIGVTCGWGADNALTKQEKADGWILLFDGKTLNGWDSDVRTNPGRAAAPAQPPAAPLPGQYGMHPRPCSTAMGKAAGSPGASHWEVIGGMIQPCGEPDGYLTSKENYKDFVLDVDFRTAADTNSGVFIRSPEGRQGYEIQIWQKQAQGYNTASIVGTAKTDRQYDFVPGKWNHFEITAQGDHMTVVMNGTKTVDAHDAKFPEGRVRLQYNKFPIEFKNIKLKLLK